MGITTYSWTEAEQIIEFYEQLRIFIKHDWKFEYFDNDGGYYQVTNPKNGVIYAAPTLEILLGNIKREK